MGLTASSMACGALDHGLRIVKSNPHDKIIALAGNPNVGKSTVFNALTGLNQHTGNWPGKTVAAAYGHCIQADASYILVDLPGTYSLLAHSAEEEAARDFLCFGGADAVIVICDATCLERSLNLVLQTLEITNRVVVCVNLLDEARRKKIEIDLDTLQKELGVPVVGASARDGSGLDELIRQAGLACQTTREDAQCAPVYPDLLEQALALLTPVLEQNPVGALPSRWTALRLLESDRALIRSIKSSFGFDPAAHPLISRQQRIARQLLRENGISDRQQLDDCIVSSLMKRAGQLAQRCVHLSDPSRTFDLRLDHIFTGRITGRLVMLLMLAGILWLTIVGANYPSAWLSSILFRFQDTLSSWFHTLNTPAWLHGALVEGAYRVLAWVISVMLPPMAIFFPLFTLLEDFGYLPRVAFNLDHAFHRAKACGKQALCMCMGFGCNAAGVIGCRIIDSPRERLIAILTNSLVPCNGRFPAMITLISLFFIGTAEQTLSVSLLSALFLTIVIIFGIFLTFLFSRLLSETLLKGIPSSFTLELPPYRPPQIGRVIVRSVFDRTLFVLGRAAAVAAPAGLIIWGMANITIGEQSLLAHCATFLDPFGRLLGMDGIILTAFLLGFPANEIVLPIALMGYLSTGTLEETEGIFALREILISNGWTGVTALCTILFSLLHWPCSTTCLTVHKETRSLRWTAAAMLLPTGAGIFVCATTAAVARALGIG